MKAERSIPIEINLPLEWGSLPAWVKEELMQAPAELSFYSWYIQKLVDHGESMRTVWQIFEAHRGEFASRPPVHSLLSLLHRAKLGPDPGPVRSVDDRRSIAAAVDKHVSALNKLLDILATGSGFGSYPFVVADGMAAVAYDVATDRVATSLEGIREFLDRMEGEKVSREIKIEISEELDSLQTQIEAEIMDLFSHPRQALQALADSTAEWASIRGWGRNDAIWCIGNSLSEWFGRNQPSATATLATAVLEEDITVDMVSGVLRRRGSRSA